MLNQALSAPMDADRLRRVFDRSWPDLKRRLDLIQTEENVSKEVRSERELLDELVGLVRNLSIGRNQQVEDDEQYAEMFSKKRVPKSAVWKTVHDVSNAAILAMSDEDLESYKLALHVRWNATSSRGEEDALEGKEHFVDKEILRRKSARISEKPRPIEPDGGEGVSLKSDGASSP